MSWFTDNTAEHKSVNIFVFDLDTDGNPTSTVLFSRENVANVDNEWNTFVFPTELTAPRGYACNKRRGTCRTGHRRGYR